MLENASAESGAPSSPLVQAPVATMAKPVTEHTTMVSIKVPSMAMLPWRAGWSVCAEAWAMGALPRPASLEKMPRAMPKRIASFTAAPAKPPAAAVPVKASLKHRAMAAGRALAWSASTNRPASR